MQAGHNSTKGLRLESMHARCCNRMCLNCRSHSASPGGSPGKSAMTRLAEAAAAVATDADAPEPAKAPAAKLKLHNHPPASRSSAKHAEMYDLPPKLPGRTKPTRGYCWSVDRSTGQGKFVVDIRTSLIAVGATLDKVRSAACWGQSEPGLRGILL